MPHTEGSPPDLTLALAVTVADIRDAAERLRTVAKRTPVLTSRALDKALGATAFLKCENLQRVGAFKFRGAYNALAQLDTAQKARGVLTYSSGNHAQAVALAASILGIPAVIVMPANAPRVKLIATRAYLADAPPPSEVVVYDPATTVREDLGRTIAEERGLAVIPPYDHPHVIAGQGTAALELLEDAGPLDHLFVCCGGGGLLSGCAIASKATRPDCRVTGVEPELGDDATRSFRSGLLHSVRNPPTIADGARTPYLGRYTFAMLRTYVDDMTTVSDRQLAAAMGFLMERLRIVVEPTGALAAAGALRAARERPADLAGSRIGIIVSGGNVDLNDIPALLALAEA